MLTIQYDEKYYTTNNYENYLSKRDRYKKLAHELYTFFSLIKIDNKHINVLDYGCALGFFLDGLKDVGIQNTFGYDISEWALSKVNSEKHSLLNYEQLFENKYNFVYFLDVLEHMKDEEIHNVLIKLDTNKIIVRIPVSLNDGENFHLEVSRNDKTHINCKTKEDWIEYFKKYNYKTYILLNLNSIYDSEGVFCAILSKEGLYNG
jgi:hypothetical protein